MNRLTASTLSAALLLTLLAGCPGPESDTSAAAPDTSLVAGAEICEALPPVDSMRMAAVDTAAPEFEPETEPEPPPRPRTLPRMWDFGSENCLPCQEMARILNPMMSEYAGKVDIRIINVYDDQSATQEAGIQVIPTQVFYAPDGEELFRHVGVYPRDSLTAKFREYGWE